MILKSMFVGLIGVLLSSLSFGKEAIFPQDGIYGFWKETSPVETPLGSSSMSSVTTLLIEPGVLFAFTRCAMGGTSHKASVFLTEEFFEITSRVSSGSGKDYREEGELTINQTKETIESKETSAGTLRCVASLQQDELKYKIEANILTLIPSVPPPRREINPNKPYLLFEHRRPDYGARTFKFESEVVKQEK